jgi:hypothetical protein
LEALKVSTDTCKGTARTSVISVPGLIDIWDLLLEAANQREEHDAIGHHGKWITLGNALFAEDEEGEAIACADYKGCPMLVAVEREPCSGRPFVMHRSQHGEPFALLECILGINEEESAPFLLCRMHLPEKAHDMDATFNAGFKSGT